MRNAEKDAVEKAERRVRLLEAAFRLMSARSIEAVKLTEIADAAGLGIVTLYRYFKTKPDLVIELGTVLWRKYYVEVEKAYAARGGAAMNAAEEMEFFLDSIIELYRSHKDVLKFSRNFDTYVNHQECTAEQMRPYNEAVEVFAHKFHVVYEKAMKDGTLDIRVSEKRLFVGTLYAVLSVAGKFAEGLVYPSEDHHNMLEELQMIKQMILGALKKGRMGTAGRQSRHGPHSPHCPPERLNSMKKLAIFAVAAGLAACALGNTVTEEPDAFLEYIEATGSQYIDTGVNAETGLKAQIDFAWASGNISSNDWSLLDATTNNTDMDKRTRFLMCHMYKQKPYFGYGVKQRRNPAFSVPFVGGQRCEIITDMIDPDSLELYQDGVKTFSEEDLETFKTNGLVNLNLNLFVFACNLSGSPSWYGQGRLYELKIWKKNLESGELDLIRHYLPCIKGGRAGLYDKVEGKIYYSFDADNNFIAGPVISNEPTLITTREGLAAIANDLGGSYALGADIDLGGADWTPIGTESAPFTGTLRGNDRAIRNLFCTNSLSGSDYRGLFGCVSNATIESVSVSGVVAGKQYVGGLVGCVTGGTVISNCIATVEIAATNMYAGGLIGACAGGSAINRIVDCRADGFVSGSGMAGGFIGYVYAPAVISNCVARGDVRSAASDYGGFIGRLAHDDAIIDGCWCSGAVWGTGGDIGSFIGQHVRGTNVNCAVSAYANGPRPFCGNDPVITGGRLTQTDIKARSDGWPEAPKRAKSSAMIPISTQEELLAVTNNPSGSYVLTADIDFVGETIEPIGNYRNPFKGEFYGQNHKISNFYIDTTDKYAGLSARSTAAA